MGKFNDLSLPVGEMYILLPELFRMGELQTPTMNNEITRLGHSAGMASVIKSADISH